MGLVIAGALIAGIIGWHASRAHMSHRGIPVRRRQLRDFRKDRTRHSIWLLLLVIIMLLMLLGVSEILHS
jgi:hypothetical protein